MEVLQAYRTTYQLVNNNNSELVNDFNYYGMLNDLGLIYISLYKYKESEEIYHEILNTLPFTINQIISLDSKIINYNYSTNQINALSNLANLKSKLNQFTEVYQIYEVLLLIDSNNSVHYHNYGNYLLQYHDSMLILSQRDELINKSINLFNIAIDLNPNLFQSHSNLAITYCIHSENRSLTSYHFETAMNITYSINKNDYWTLRLLYITSIIPVIILDTTTGSIDNIRNEYVKLLLDFTANVPNNTIYDVINSIGCGSLGYYAIYHGYEDLAIRQLHANIYWKSSYNELKSQRTSPMAFTPTRHNNKIKVGFLSSYFYRHSVGLLLQGVILNLNSEIFDIYVIQLSTSTTIIPDYILEKFIYNENITFIGLTGSLVDIRDHIISLRLDILVYGEIGMGSYNYFLSFSRLADKTIVFWGHAVSSGISEASYNKYYNITNDINNDTIGGPDYFISSVLFESNIKYSQLEYSERLILLDSLTSYFYYPNLPLSQGELNITNNSNKYNRVLRFPIKRALDYNHLQLIDELSDKSINEFDLILPNAIDFLIYINPNLSNRLGYYYNHSYHLFIIPQTLYKLHLTFDNILLQLLLRDPLAIISFPAPSNPIYSNLIYKRLCYLFSQSNKVDLLDRIYFNTRLLSEREYITYCAIADIILDPYPLGGGRSSLEIFSTYNPIIVLESRTSILQLTRAMYDIMGIRHIPIGENSTCCVFDNEDDYIDISIKIVSERKNLESIRKLIELYSYRLYQNKTIINEWEKILMFINNNPRPIPNPISIAEISNNLSDHNIDILNYLFNQKNYWNKQEINYVIFTYTDPPIYLRDIELKLENEVIYKNNFLYKNESVDLIIYSNDVWEDKCKNLFTSHSVLANAYACAILRLFKENRQSLLFDVNIQNLNKSFPIYKGDDIGQLIHLLEVTYKLDRQQINDVIHQIVPRYVSTDLIGSDEWIYIRRTMITSYLKHKRIKSNKFPNNTISDDKIAVNKSDYLITLVIPTCKRLNLFMKTIESILTSIYCNKSMNTCYNLNDQFIKDIIIIDDNSSLDDRIYMMTKYPMFTFIFKSVNSKGHAHSMNTIWNIVSTKYLLYIEDDMSLIDKDNYVSNSLFNESMNRIDELLSINRFVSNILISLGILGYEGEITLPSSEIVTINTTITRNIKIDQVLFNDQSNRNCANGVINLCKFNDVKYGLESYIDISINNSIISDILYYYHEFGLLTLKYNDIDLNDFSYWPGFSLHPGLTDIHSIKQKLHPWCMQYYQNKNCNPFNESDLLFEHGLSLLLYELDVHMVYLPQVIFHHSNNISAYTLQNYTRPY